MNRGQAIERLIGLVDETAERLREVRDDLADCHEDVNFVLRMEIGMARIVMDDLHADSAQFLNRALIDVETS